MKVVLNIDCNGALREGDVIVYEKGRWVAVSKEVFLNDLVLEIQKTNKQVEDFYNLFDTFKLAVNEVLKNHHEILQILTKEDK